MIQTSRRGFLALTGAAAGAGMAALTGCGSDDTTGGGGKGAATVEEEVIQPPQSCLTGEDLDQELVGKRPIALTIDNLQPANPHYGASKAGIIFEVPVEGNITRELHVFEDYRDLDQLGNVRSARPCFLSLAREFNAILIHFGHSEQAQQAFDNDYIDHVDGVIEGDYFFRTDDRPAPHNAFTSTELVDKAIADHGFKREYAGLQPTHFVFSDDEVTLDDGQPATELHMYNPINTPYFTYDDSTKLYQRFQYGEPEMDQVTGEQLAVRNVIWQYAPWSMYDEKHLKFQLVGTGDGMFFTGGKGIPITWQREEQDDHAHYFDADGNEIKVNKGKSWVCIMQNDMVDDNSFA